MKVAIISPLYPYRGGIAQFGDCLGEELSRRVPVKGFNFKRQYPGLLFPGKTQYVEDPDSSPSIDDVRVLDSIGPFSWKKTVKAVKEWGADVALASWWMPYFGPSLGYVARHLKKSGVKVVSIMHNALPHEARMFDAPLTRYFVEGCSAHVSLSSEVDRDLRENFHVEKTLSLFHPVYSQFGRKLEREDAEKRIGIPHGDRTLLFFGLIRKYKGLDILLEAMKKLPPEYRLVIAGEPYDDFSEYQKIIDSSPGLSQRVFVFPGYVKDADVKSYFSAADLVVLPYRSATQSGVNAVANAFDVPMVVTDVGSLKRVVGDSGTGIVASKAEPDDIAGAILHFFNDSGVREGCLKAIAKEKERLGWGAFCDSLMEFIKNL